MTDVERVEVSPTFAKYRILGKIGEGGSGFVYRAIDEATGAVVALKTARDRREVRLQSIRREIESLRQLRHMGIVQILDGGVIDGKPWYSMELLEGHTLWSRLRTLSGDSGGEGDHLFRNAEASTLAPTSSAPLRPPTGADGREGARIAAWIPRPEGRGDACGGQLAEFLTLFRRICEPLAYLHGERYVHRDLKPSNVFIRSDGTPVLMDFGLALLLEKEVGRASLAVSAIRAGTLGYIAPEQLRGHRVDARADLFALGCMMYEAVTGRLPFVAENSNELSLLHASRFVQPPSALVRGVPPELEELILGLLAIKPRERIGHATHVAAILEKMGAVSWPHRADPTPRSYLYRPELNGRDSFAQGAQGVLGALTLRGRGGILLLSGESGIGKTTALVEMVRLAEERGIRAVAGECVAIASVDDAGVRRSEPLNAFRQLLMAVFDRCAAQGTAVTRLLLGDNLGVLAACEPSLLEVPGADAAPAVAELPAEASRRRLFEALAGTLASYAGQKPLVLVIDDFQWADDLSIGFLRFLPAAYFQDNPILLVVSHRTEDKRDEIEALAALPHVERLRLELLDQASIRAMAEDMLAQRGLSESLIQFLFRESAGNPFVVSEYLRTAADHGFLIQDSLGRWRPANDIENFQSLKPPGSLRDVLLSRLDDLSAGARAVMEVVAILGRESDLSDVAALASDLGEETFGRSLHELRGREIVVDSALGCVRFAHDRLREVAYELIPPERRLVLHRRAGLRLEQGQSTLPSRRVWAAELAHHFEQAEDPARAAGYWQEAAEVAHRAFANRETLSFIQKAVALDKVAGITRDAVALGHRERIRAEALQGVGDSAGALEGLLSSARLLNARFPHSRLGVQARCAWEALAEGGRRLVSGGDDDGVDPADRERILESSRVYQQLPSVFYYVTGDANQVLCAALMNLSLAETLGASAELATAVAGIHISAGFVPLHGLAEFYGRVLRAMLEEVADEAAVTWALINTAAYALGTCRWQVVRADTERVRRTARRIGFHRRWEEATAQLGTMLFVTGDILGAAATFAELKSSAERGDNQTQSWALGGMAQVKQIAGEHAEAHRLLVQAEGLLGKGLTRAEQIYTLGPYAVSCLHVGDMEGARRAAFGCANWISQGAPIACYTIFAYASAVEAFHRLMIQNPDDVEVKQGFHRMVRELRRMAKVFPAARSFASIWEGVALERAGRRGRAIASLETGLADARQYGLPIEEALAESGLAALSDEEGQGVDAGTGQHSKRALEIAARIGASIVWPSVRAS